MEWSLVLGVSVTVLALGGWIVGSVLLRRHAREGAVAQLSPADRAAALRGVSLHEQATAGQMAAMASAQRQ